MKLIFDQNLSYRLVARLAVEFPDSTHVRDIGLKAHPDADIWHYAAKHALTIVSKDEDFQQRALLFGPPPKVIWIRVGNCATEQIVALLKARLNEISNFDTDPTAAFLALS